MSVADPFTHRLRVSQLNPRSPTELTLEPDAGQRAAIAAELDLLDLPALRMAASIFPAPHGAWELTGRLTARVVQPCGVTLNPVETALDEEIRRVWTPYATTPEGEEVEMPDADVEPLGQSIDAGAVMIEALSLALPEYPRSPEVELDPPAEAAGEAEEGEETRKPFSGLADLLAGKPPS